MKTGRETVAAALSFGGDKARYAELARSGGGWLVRGAETFYLPDGCVFGGCVTNGAALGACLRRALRSRWKDRPLAVAIPTADCIFRDLSLPVADADEAREAVRLNFSAYFHFPVEEALFDVCSSRDDEPLSARKRFLAVAAPRGELMPLFEALRGVRSRAALAEPAAVAAARALTDPGGPDDANGRLLAVCGDGIVDLCFVRSGACLLCRGLPFDENGDPASSAGSAADEIQKTLGYVRRTFSVSPVPAVAGLGPFAEALREALSVPAAARAEVPAARRLTFEDPGSSAWYAVAGLLLRYARER